MCALVYENGGEEPAPPRDELLLILDAEGFTAMTLAANNCPACILSALRTKNANDQTGPYVIGPEDGRQTWDYKQAKTDFWSDFNSGQAEKHREY